MYMYITGHYLAMYLLWEYFTIFFQFFLNILYCSLLLHLLHQLRLYITLSIKYIPTICTSPGRVSLVHVLTVPSAVQNITFFRLHKRFTVYAHTHTQNTAASVFLLQSRLFVCLKRTRFSPSS